MSSPETAPVTVIGSYLSPYVRKVLACLELKGVAYEIDPIVPFFGGERFTELSPIRRIPVLIEGDFVLNDSTVICQYLEDTRPTPALLPKAPRDAARARWLEEFADSRLGDVFIWKLYAQVTIRPLVWKEEPDRALMARALAEDVPQIMDYLERQAPDEGYLFGTIGVADIAIASFFRNLDVAKIAIDAERWPRAHRWVRTVLGHPVLQKLKGFEDVMIGTAVSERRARLEALGAPLTEQSLAVREPRRGVMPI